MPERRVARPDSSIYPANKGATWHLAAGLVACARFPAIRGGESGASPLLGRRGVRDPTQSPGPKRGSGVGSTRQANGSAARRSVPDARRCFSPAGGSDDTIDPKANTGGQRP